MIKYSLKVFLALIAVLIVGCSDKNVENKQQEASNNSVTQFNK